MRPRDCLPVAHVAPVLVHGLVASLGVAATVHGLQRAEVMATLTDGCFVVGLECHGVGPRECGVDGLAAPSADEVLVLFESLAFTSVCAV